jgi:hypothetical protein
VEFWDWAIIGKVLDYFNVIIKKMGCFGKKLCNSYKEKWKKR